MHNVLLRKYVSIDFKMDSIMFPNIDGKNASVDAKIRWLSLSFIGFFGGGSSANERGSSKGPLKAV